MMLPMPPTHNHMPTFLDMQHLAVPYFGIGSFQPPFPFCFDASFSAFQAPYPLLPPWSFHHGRSHVTENDFEGQVPVQPSHNLCKHTKRPKYWQKLGDNSLDLVWVYSVPCGKCHDGASWWFLLPDAFPASGTPEFTNAKKTYLVSHGWDDKKFRCPQCTGRTHVF